MQGYNILQMILKKTESYKISIDSFLGYIKVENPEFLNDAISLAEIMKRLADANSRLNN